jgi:hypothetical protein
MKDTPKNEMISDRLEEHICKGKIYKFISTDLIKDTWPKYTCCPSTGNKVTQLKSGQNLWIDTSSKKTNR